MVYHDEINATDQSCYVGCFHVFTDTWHQYSFVRWHSTPIFMSSLILDTNIHVFADTQHQCSRLHWHSTPMFTSSLTLNTNVHVFADTQHQCSHFHWHSTPMFMSSLALNTNVHVFTDIQHQCLVLDTEARGGNAYCVGMGCFLQCSVLFLGHLLVMWTLLSSFGP